MYMRTRAAVLIGVRKTGQLHPLQAVDSGINEVEAWLTDQPGFIDSKGSKRVVILTDLKGPVQAKDIRDAIKQFVELATIEQLFVFFAGHGVNIRFSEYWLLSGAPEDPNEAVNLRSSADLARYCGIPHVVFVSDACRTAADSIQAQAVEGTVIFPNPGLETEPGNVDIFYASMVGRPALEIRDADSAAAAFEAVYTKAFVYALSGLEPTVVETAGKPQVGLVHPWPLKRYLERKVPNLLVERGVGIHISQKPDAIITSEPQEWLAEVQTVDTTIIPRDGAELLGTTAYPRLSKRSLRLGTGAMEPDDAESLIDVAQNEIGRVPGFPIRNGINDAPLKVAQRTRGDLLGTRNVKSLGASSGESVAGKLFRQMYDRIASTPAPHDFKTEWGFEVHGTTIANAYSDGGALQLPQDLAGLQSVSGNCAYPTNVLIVFSDGRGSLLPAIPGLIGVLTYDAHLGELLSVEYEPSGNTLLFRQMGERLQDLRTLRRTIAAAAGLGAFRLSERTDVNALLDRMKGMKSIDPACAVYLAYALHDLQRRDEIIKIAKNLRNDLDFELFDIWMLSQRPTENSIRAAHGVFPSVPLLSQGWGLLDAINIELPFMLRKEQLRPHVSDSLWTLFDAEGVALVRRAID